MNLISPNPSKTPKAVSGIHHISKLGLSQIKPYHLLENGAIDIATNYNLMKFR